MKCLLPLTLLCLAFAPAPLSRREPRTRCWQGTYAGRPVSVYFFPDGAYREDWCGTLYVGKWECREGGWVSVECAREGNGGTRFDLKYERDGGVLTLAGYGVRMTRR